eukprot:NODE_1_length_5406_cov_250.279447_g0_i0.p2 GENE.NODE_1_length_5406_cov_250.279447_g0_i0~~NODE_1_length_5406_cov_250.279447_g0_i0.p2  ORF type:complete len:403 (+),score=-39.50 NODE_1_length_5406_cov_250.279447_g0_i0:4066-5274(+)
MDGDMDYYMIFKDLQVCYPQDDANAYGRVELQGPPQTAPQPNSFRQTHISLRDEPVEEHVPSITSDDMNFDAMSASYPIIVNVSTFSTPRIVLVTFKNMGQAAPVGDQFLEPYMKAQHPISWMFDTMRCSYDWHVKLVCIKNSFQNGVLRITTGQKLRTDFIPTDASTATIHWNIAEQDSIEFDMPFVHYHRFFANRNQDNRTFLIQNTSIIPTMTGVGDTIYIYAIVTARNIKVFGENGPQKFFRATRRYFSLGDKVEKDEEPQKVELQGPDSFTNLTNLLNRPQTILGDASGLYMTAPLLLTSCFQNFTGPAALYRFPPATTSSGLNRGAPIDIDADIYIDNTRSTYDVYPLRSTFDTSYDIATLPYCVLPYEGSGEVRQIIDLHRMKCGYFNDNIYLVL